MLTFVFTFNFVRFFRLPAFSYLHFSPKIVKSCHIIVNVNAKTNTWNIFSNIYFPWLFAAIGEPESIDWYNPQGEKIISTQRVAVQKEGVRSRLTIYNANIEDAGIYRCQATDAKGQTQEATVVLEIYRKSCIY